MSNDLRREDNDAQRFAGWVREHGRAVRGFLAAMLRRADLVDELSQEVFCRAWQARSRYHEQGATRAYLLRIADRLACDCVRRSPAPFNLDEAGWKQHEPWSDGEDPSEAAQQAEEAAQLAVALGRLSSDQRRVLLLRYYGQFAFAEIAAITGYPLNTTLSHCHRGLKTLRKLLVEQCP
jgi:RNA polymerase sigma-70 factor (ECF subfamily)